MAEEDKRNYPNPPPTVDPTVLTTEALHREVAAFRELVFERMDRNSQVSDEKFRSIEIQFRMMERQRVEQKEDTKVAVVDALAAAKEAVKEQTTASETSTAKSEAAMVKAIEQLGEKFETAFEGQRRESGDIKERLTTLEQRKVGGKEATTEHRSTFQPFQVAIIAILGSAVVGILIAVLQ